MIFFPSYHGVGTQIKVKKIGGVSFNFIQVSMTTLIYELPFEQIHYLERPEFHEMIDFQSRILEL